MFIRALVLCLVASAAGQQCLFTGQKIVSAQSQGFVASCNFGTPASSSVRCLVANETAPMLQTLSGTPANFSVQVVNSTGGCLRPTGCDVAADPCATGCASWDDAFCYTVQAGVPNYFSLYISCANVVGSCAFDYQFRMASYCGDGQCSSLEDCGSCPGDCGTCLVSASPSRSYSRTRSVPATPSSSPGAASASSSPAPPSATSSPAPPSATSSPGFSTSPTPSPAPPSASSSPAPPSATSSSGPSFSASSSLVPPSATSSPSSAPVGAVRSAAATFGASLFLGCWTFLLV